MSWQTALAVIILAASAALAAGGLVASGVLESTELHGYDLLAEIGGQAPPASELVIVDFDDETVEKLGVFPIPRGILAEILERIAAARPAVIGLDMLLSEKRTPEEDQRMEAVLARAGNVVLVEAFATGSPAAVPLPRFRGAALAVGFANLPVDEDGMIRRMFLVVRTAECSGISLPVALASQYLGQPLEPLRPGVYRLGSAEIILASTRPATALIGAWAPLDAYHTVPASRLLGGEADAQTFRDKIVLVGQSSAAGNDLYATPVFRFRRPEHGRSLLSGTEVHAAAVSALLQRRVIAVLSRGLLWIVNLLAAGLVVAVVLLVRPLYSIPGTLLVLGGGILLAQILFSGFQLWMRFVSTELSVLLAFPAALSYRFVQEQRHRLRAQTERDRESQERQKLEQELTMARAIQEGLLPKVAPALEGVEIAARHRTSLLVGGDYYDFLLLDPTRLLFIVADVQGKGASAALIMSNVQATLHSVVRQTLLARRRPVPASEQVEDLAQSLEEIVLALNDSVLEHAHGNRLVTMFLGLLDASSKGLRYINAGHVRPVVLRADGHPLVLSEGGMVTGLFPQTHYPVGMVQLQTGDVILACTDGITEAMRADDEEYQSERMVNAAAACLTRSALEIVEAVLADVQAFAPGERPQDDMVMMAIKVL